MSALLRALSLPHRLFNFYPGGGFPALSLSLPSLFASLFVHPRSPAPTPSPLPPLQINHPDSGHSACCPYYPAAHPHFTPAPAGYCPCVPYLDPRRPKGPICQSGSWSQRTLLNRQHPSLRFTPPIWKSPLTATAESPSVFCWSRQNTTHSTYLSIPSLPRNPPLIHKASVSACLD